MSDSRALEGIRVLIAEDSQDIQLLMARMLAKLGALVKTANDGSEALDRMKEGDFDVIFLDIQMPVLDGHETVKRIRDSGYDKPVIALTAHAFEEEYEKSRAAGFDDHLTKPIEISLLVQKVRFFTDQKLNQKPRSGALPRESSLG